MSPYLSIIIPAYNEESRLAMTVWEVHLYLEKHKKEYEIILVNDGSTDHTSKVMKQLAQEIPQVKWFRIPHTGKGGAVAKGMEKSKGAICLFMDADNSTSIHHIEDALQYIDAGYEIVIGSRTHPQSVLQPPQQLWKQVIGKLGNGIIRSVVVPDIYDTQCGFKVFTKLAADYIFPRLTTTGWAFDVETLLLAQEKGFRIKEMPVLWKNDPESKVTARGYVSALQEVFKLARRYKKPTS